MADVSVFEPSYEDIEVTHIDTNPDNPRGLSVREDDPRFIYLRESVAEFGILVPLVVVGPLQDHRYLLIDGERRLEAARAMGMKTVPTYVLTKELDAANIRRTMFHIHQNREQWNSAQQCRACEPLYEELRARHGGNLRAMAEDLAGITGTPLETAHDRIRFLCWPQSVKNLVYNPANHEFYTAVVEIEKQIIQAANRNYPEYFERVDVDDVRQYLFRKYEEDPLGVRAIRSTAGKIAKSRFTGEAKGVVVEILVKLAQEQGFGFEDALEEFREEFPEIDERTLPGPRRLVTLIQNLSQLLDEYEWERLKTAKGRSAADPDEMVTALRQLGVAVGETIDRVRDMTD